MLHLRTGAGCIAAFMLSRPLPAQTDYHHLSRAHPLRGQAAATLGRGVAEVALAWRTGGGDGQPRTHEVEPEIALGIRTNLELRAEAHAIVRPDGTRWNGATLGVLFGAASQSRRLPAIALGGDFTPGRRDEPAHGTLRLLATRTLGLTRVHAAAATSLGAGRIDDHETGIAIDRTFYRQSLLAVAELVVAYRDGVSRAQAGAGLRWQWTPLVVLDAGVSRGLRRDGLPLTLGLGASYAIPTRIGGGR